MNSSLSQIEFLSACVPLPFGVKCHSRLSLKLESSGVIIAALIMVKSKDFKTRNRTLLEL